jgi:hypothetical protein
MRLTCFVWNKESAGQTYENIMQQINKKRLLRIVKL